MCELLGICCNKDTDIKFSFEKLKKESKIHEHGWGIAFYRKSTFYSGESFATIIKEPCRASDSIFSDLVKNKIKSRIFIAHVRMASTGVKVPLNTHPFELMLDPRPDSDKEKSWVFAHNGTIKGLKEDERFESEIKTQGNTDSEFAFCYIMGELRKQYRKNKYSLSDKEKFEIIKRSADKISKAYPYSLNFLMSDGKRLYAYYGGNDSSGGLHYLKRDCGAFLRDVSDGMTLELKKAPGETACIVATKKLTNELGWKEFKVNSLVAFENGEMVDDGGWGS